jgi:ParB family transcriptional regulator, chromosome partitioning protein
MSDAHGKKKALGRGLSALLENPETDITTRDISSEYTSGSVAQIRIEQIESNPFQPRKHFRESELAELALSIQQQGIIQPLTVRKLGHDKFQLIAGERRLKASKIAGLSVVPAYIRIANDEQMLEMALVENIQREDLNPLEIAISFQRLLEECKIRQEELSIKVGKDRSTISNYIRLLRLPTEIQVAVRDNLISMGHARAIINVEDEKEQLIILQQILEQKMSVRQVEETVRERSKQRPAHEKESTILPPKFDEARKKINFLLDAKVEMKVNYKGTGKIIISFSSEEDLDRILTKFES